MNFNYDFSLMGNKIFDFGSIICEVMKSDIEILDRDRNRIVGYGVCKDNSRLISDGIIYEEVFDTNRAVIIQDPRRNILCQSCLEKARCLEQMELAFPIIVKGDAIGVVGVIVSTVSQKNYIVENYRFILSFMEKICALIASGLLCAAEMNELKSEVNRLQKQNQNLQSVDFTQLLKNQELSEIKTLEEIEKENIERALNKYGRDTNGKKLAAEALGIGIATLYRKING